MLCMTSPETPDRLEESGGQTPHHIDPVTVLRSLAAQTCELTGQMDVDSTLEREIAETSAIRANDAVADIQHSLERLDAGTYGTCEQCGGPIRFERLEAIPHARLCVACSGYSYGPRG
jgi:RNA polymerase-binding transcription factor DksA